MPGADLEEQENPQKTTLSATSTATLEDPVVILKYSLGS